MEVYFTLEGDRICAEARDDGTRLAFGQSGLWGARLLLNDPSALLNAKYDALAELRGKIRERQALWNAAAEAVSRLLPERPVAVPSETDASN